MRFRSLLVFAALIVVASQSSAAEDAKIKAAIQKGSKYLLGIHQPGQGVYDGGSKQMGSACLAGLALLEAGVDEDDPSLKNIIAYVRNGALSQTRTYEVSLTIMFLDRLGKKYDVPVIQFLGVRLIAGQGRPGGWSYDCGHDLSAQDAAILRVALQKEAILSGEAPRQSPKDSPKKKEPPKERPRTDLPVDSKAPPESKSPPNREASPKPPKPASHSGLHPEVVKWLKFIQSVPRESLVADVSGDNSNTQFAVLGLWCARKHAVPCDSALAAVGKLFRFGQQKDGGWPYPIASALMPITIEKNSTPSMTCAGLIGIAASIGTQSVLKSKPKSPDGKTAPGSSGIVDDAAVRAALKCLAGFISQARAEARGMGPNVAQGQGSDRLSGNLYFLWSLERTAVIYDLKTIGDHDWYAWGADALVRNQNAEDGSWGSSDPNTTTGDVNTCFAILFLCRANVAKDLTAKLTGGHGLKIGSDVPAIKSPRVDPKKDPVTTVEPKKDPVVSKPPAEVEDDLEKETARLSNSLISAKAEARPAILAKLRDNKGGVFTEALVRAIGKLEGEAQTQARDALAKRLSRMTAGTLREMLKDENRELRRAAALACASKRDKQFVPDLINALSDKDDLAASAARSGLRQLTEKDFGPEPNASETDKAKAIRAWKSWWASQK